MRNKLLTFAALMFLVNVLPFTGFWSPAALHLCCIRSCL